MLGAYMGSASVASLSRASLDDTSPYAIVDQLARVLVLIENEYVDAVDRERLLAGAIKGMVKELDPHSSYLPAQDFNILRDDSRGQFAGIGVEVDFRDDRVTVIAPIEGSPAYDAGIRPGDQVVSINGLSVRGKTASALIKQMRGAPGSTVKVGVRRDGLQKPLLFSLQRKVISVSSVLGVPLDRNIAYVRIKQFQATSHSEVIEAIAALREQLPAIEGVLLDMRNNPGGLVRAATSIADEFLAGGVIYSTRHRGKIVSQVSANRGGALLAPPVVVLVNEFSASASELVAGALQDHGRATVVGAQTFGKGSVQSIIDLPHGAGLRLTTMRYYTPRGRTIQVEGITPDILVQTGTGVAGFKVIREQNLDNHLHSDSSKPKSRLGEGPVEPAPDSLKDRATSVRTSEPSKGSKATSTHLGVARTVPANPTGGADKALSVAYGVLLGAMSVPLSTAPPTSPPSDLPTRRQ